MTIDDIKNTLSEYFNEIAVIAENSDSDSKTVTTSLHGNSIEVGIVKTALKTVDKIKKQDAQESHNS